MSCTLGVDEKHINPILLDGYITMLSCTMQKTTVSET